MTTPPTQAQPSFYEAVKADMGYDPMTARDLPRSHESFLIDVGYHDWLTRVLRLVDRNIPLPPKKRVPRQRQNQH